MQQQNTLEKEVSKAESSPSGLKIEIDRTVKIQDWSCHLSYIQPRSDRGEVRVFYTITEYGGGPAKIPGIGTKGEFFMCVNKHNKNYIQSKIVREAYARLRIHEPVRTYRSNV